MRGDSFFHAQVAMIYCLGVMQLPQNKEAMVGSIINSFKKRWPPARFGPKVLYFAHSEDEEEERDCSVDVE